MAENNIENSNRREPLLPEVDESDFQILQNEARGNKNIVMVALGHLEMHQPFLSPHCINLAWGTGRPNTSYLENRASVYALTGRALEIAYREGDSTEMGSVQRVLPVVSQKTIDDFDSFANAWPAFMEGIELRIQREQRFLYNYMTEYVADKTAKIADVGERATEQAAMLDIFYRTYGYINAELAAPQENQ